MSVVSKTFSTPQLQSVIFSPLSVITLQDNSLDFEELRCHFTKKQWEELKEIEKIRFKNLKSNHLFKLSIGNVLYVTW